MNILLDALSSKGSKPALLSGKGKSLSGIEVVSQVRALAVALSKNNARCIAVTLENSPAWIIADLACQQAKIPMVPVPGFFTASQVDHVLASARVDTVLGNKPDNTKGLLSCGELIPGIPAWSRAVQMFPGPPDTVRITFTSGTTGTPKGVCLPGEAMEQVAVSLANALSGLSVRRYLAVLPLSVLLENVAGVYAGILLGAEIVLPGAKETGLSGSSSFNPCALISSIKRYRSHSLILLPQMLKALVTQLATDGDRLDGLEFVAVGGARTAPDLIRKARALGIPAYEGYGLTECSSVVALNTPHQDRPGSVGQLLPHQRIRFSKKSEIFVGGNIPYSYLGESNSTEPWLSTGDLGSIDEDGFLYIKGRKQEALITAFGRNVSPEWVESELLANAGIDQVMVLGDDLPGLIALIAPANGTPDRHIDTQVQKANRQLPDYAKIAAWRAVPHFSAKLGQLTANGRPKRNLLQISHAALIAELTNEIESIHAGNANDFLPDTY